MRLLMQNIIKILGLSKIRLKVIQILRSFRTKDHSLHSMETMDNIRDSCPHIGNGDPLLPKIAGDARPLKRNLGIDHLEELPGREAPSSLSLNDKGDKLFGSRNNMVVFAKLRFSFICGSGSGEVRETDFRAIHKPI